MSKFELGSTVKDMITYYEGIVTTNSQHLYSAPGCWVTSRELDKDGNPKEPVWFPEARLVQVTG